MEKLEYFLNNASVPVIENKPKTFLGIAKQPHYEVVLSNIYAFFFHIDEPHHLKDLFITSLLQLISENQVGNLKNFSDFKEFEIKTEVATKAGGRIDLLLQDDNHAIVIENKIYHTLVNNLPDYWKSIKGRLQEQCIGIVLSLYPIKYLKHPQFINITHLQLLNKVMDQIGGYLLEADANYLVFLKDLYQNTINMSSKTMKSEDIAFYKKYHNEIHSVSRFLNSFEEYVKKEVENTCELLNEEKVFLRLRSKTGDRLRCYESINNPNLMIIVGFDRLYNNKHKSIWIVVELQGSILKDREQFKAIQFNEEEQQIIKSEFYFEKKIGWSHLAIKTYPLEKIDFENLQTYLADKIKEDHLLSIFNKVDNYLSGSKSKL